jgi:hypothetical protein
MLLRQYNPTGSGRVRRAPLSLQRSNEDNPYSVDIPFSVYTLPLLLFVLLPSVCLPRLRASDPWRGDDLL